MIPRLTECLSDGEFYCKVSDFLFAYSGNYVILHNFPNKHLVVIGKLCKFAQKSEEKHEIHTEGSISQKAD